MSDSPRDPELGEDQDDDFEHLLDEDPEAALEEALAWLDEEPDSADAHYAAGLSYEALGRDGERVQEFLQVLRLDARGPAPPIADHERLVAEEAEAALARLPPEFGRRLGPVAILVAPRPTADLVKEGFDPRLLGFFDGATSEEIEGPDAPPTPTRILLFSHNLACTFEDEESLRRQVAITVLHEVGHFFGLDEADMERLGLD